MMLLERSLIKRKFTILNIDHVAVATDKIKQLKYILVDVLGMESSNKEHVISELVDVIKIFSKNKETAIELLESTSSGSVIDK